MLLCLTFFSFFQLELFKARWNCRRCYKTRIITNLLFLYIFLCISFSFGFLLRMFCELQLECELWDVSRNMAPDSLETSFLGNFFLSTTWKVSEKRGTFFPIPDLDIWLHVPEALLEFGVNLWLISVKSTRWITKIF